MKRVVIFGANSFIGTNFEEYAKKYYYKELSVDTVDMIDETWRNMDFRRNLLATEC